MSKNWLKNFSSVLWTVEEKTEKKQNREEKKIVKRCRDFPELEQNLFATLIKCELFIMLSKATTKRTQKKKNSNQGPIKALHIGTQW